MQELRQLCRLAAARLADKHQRLVGLHQAHQLLARLCDGQPLLCLLQPIPFAAIRHGL